MSIAIAAKTRYSLDATMSFKTHLLLYIYDINLDIRYSSALSNLFQTNIQDCNEFSQFKETNNSNK